MVYQTASGGSLASTFGFMRPPPPVTSAHSPSARLLAVDVRLPSGSLQIISAHAPVEDSLDQD
eukprot:5003472-Prorocentrum_lima.AAC.1